jgi:hypothetical protein
MDSGTIGIHLVDGTPRVVRCEAAPHGLRLVPAFNTALLTAQAQQALHAQGVALHEDGLYHCPADLQAAAQFPAPTLPADAITYGTARTILYPDVSTNTGWQRVRRDVAAGHLRVYQVGIGQDVRRYVSRAEVLQRAERQTAQTTS